MNSDTNCARVVYLVSTITTPPTATQPQEAALVFPIPLLLSEVEVFPVPRSLNIKNNLKSSFKPLKIYTLIIFGFR